MPSPSRSAPEVLTAVFKAYDIRGIVPDQLNADLARAVGAAFAALCRLGPDARRPGHAAVGGGADECLCGRGHRRRRRRGRSRPDLDRRAVLRVGQPRRRGRHVHRLPQSGAVTTASSSAWPGPGRSAPRPGSARSWPPSTAMAATGYPTAPVAGRRDPGRRPGGLCRQGPVVRLDSGPPPAQGHRRHRQRHGGPGRSRRCSPTCRSSWRSSSASWTGPSRTTPPTPSSPRTWWRCKHRILETGADVGLAFDGDADRCFLVDDQGVPLSGSTTTALVAAAMLEKHPGRHHPAQPHLLQGRAGDHPRAGRDPGADPGRPLLHQGHHGRHRRPLRRRAFRPLLLPGQLPGRFGFDRRSGRARGAVTKRAARCRSCAPTSSATPIRARSTPRSPIRPRSSRRWRPSSRAPGRTAWTA